MLWNVEDLHLVMTACVSWIRVCRIMCSPHVLQAFMNLILYPEGPLAGQQRRTSLISTTLVGMC